MGAGTGGRRACLCAVAMSRTFTSRSRGSRSRLAQIQAILPPGWTVYEPERRSGPQQFVFVFESPGKWRAAKWHRSYTFVDAMGYARDVRSKYEGSSWLGRIFG